MTAPAARMSPRERALRRRHRDDFLYYAPRALTIRAKSGQMIPFRLNTAQLYLHRKVEEQRARTGRVRIIIVKGRQQGCSTYVQARFYWKLSHQRGKRAFILTHQDDATQNLFEITNRYHDYCPAPLKPRTGAANAKELNFAELDSGYKVATAGSKGVGRSSTLQFFHGSEVAYWPNADTHMAGALQAVPTGREATGTEVILESTSAGRGNLFFTLAAEAATGASDYELVFIPWYWQEEYRELVPPDFARTSEEEQYAQKYGVDDEQLLWRRKKVVELKGVHHFRREYPATVAEAFSAEVPGALWRRELLDATRLPKPPVALKRIVVAIDPSGSDKPENDEQGIVAAGLGVDGHGYVLDDVSGHFTPTGWGTKAVVLYKRLRADRIVGEKNYGGDMVEHVIRTVDPKAAYKGVDATRGKQVRAEPVAALYEQGKVHHVGTFLALEDEMVTWQPGMDSPNRMDALVWALTELLLEGSVHSVAVPVGTDMTSPFEH